ncbi:MAG: methyltransferase domain-containing protein [Lentisphaerota bacterium]
MALSLGLFDRMKARKTRFQEILRLLGAVDGQSCLDLVNDPAFSMNLRRIHQVKGCRWHSAGRNQQQVDYLKAMGADQVTLVENSELPFENSSFDAIVISDFMEYETMDEKLVAECHRVLKLSGRLIISVPRAGRWSFLRSLREWFGLFDKQHGPVREGYSESQLFVVLKDGFDVQESRTVIRFFVALTDIFCQLMTGYAASEVETAGAGSEDRKRKAWRYYSALKPLFWVASLLDLLLVFANGYYIMARAKRRMWVPRRTPVLRDGRSIAEAALQTKIGTAAPF